jgi:16S rRNA (adenine1518-N6/adenine1519-N6)-dimethyltransferase
VLDARVGHGDRVLEVGAGLGSLTIALADAGCDVVAVELDRALLPALREVLDERPNVRIERLDASDVSGLASVVRGDGWHLVANLPYNVSVPLVVAVLDRIPAIRQLLVMVQREVADRFLAPPGSEAYGPVSVRVLFHADAERVRRVPREVFWPRPKVDSAIVRISRRTVPQLGTDRHALFRVVDEAFAERRKTMAGAVRRLGFDPDDLRADLDGRGVDLSSRAQDTGMFAFAALTEALLVRGWRP